MIISNLFVLCMILSLDLLEKVNILLFVFLLQGIHIGRHRNIQEKIHQLHIVLIVMHTKYPRHNLQFIVLTTSPPPTVVYSTYTTPNYEKMNEF